MFTKQFFFMLASSFLALTANTALFNSLHLHSTRETLETVSSLIQHKSTGAFFRFGDGDINLAMGENDMLQQSNHNLMLEMREALSLNGPTILKTLPLHSEALGSLESGMFPGNHATDLEMATRIVQQAQLFWGKPITDVYSTVALHYMATYDPFTCITFLKQLKKQKCILVGNENIPQNIRDILFGVDHIFIPTPTSQSYRDIDRIERETVDAANSIEGYKIIITSMGCSGRALQKRLWHKLDTMFLFDFGSLMDALCGWDTRAWISLSQFDAQKFLCNLTNNTIHVVATAALIENQYDERKKEYIHALTSLNTMGIDPYIVEPCHEGDHSFLNKYSSHVFYTHTNNHNLNNKGCNEFYSLKYFFDTHAFDDNDIIVKLTGRYLLNSNLFFNEILHHNKADAWGQYDDFGQLFTGCFAMRYGYLKKFIDSINFEYMEQYMVNIEQAASDFIQDICKDGASFVNLSKLDVTAAIFGIGIRETINRNDIWQ